MKKQKTALWGMQIITGIMAVVIFLLLQFGKGVNVSAASAPKLEKKTTTIYLDNKDYKVKVLNVSKSAVVKFSSSDKSVLRVAKKTGKVNPVGAGTANVLVNVRQKGKTVKLKQTITVKKNNSTADNTTDDQKEEPSDDPSGSESDAKTEDPSGEKTADTKDETVQTGQQDTIAEDGSYTSKEDVALYLHIYGRLPGNFITKKEAQALGWEGGSLEPYAPGKCIGGDYFGNYEGKLPEGKSYHECDIDTLGEKYRGAKRLVYSDDGYVFYTEDHYESFTLLYGE